MSGTCRRIWSFAPDPTLELMSMGPTSEERREEGSEIVWMDGQGDISFAKDLAFLGRRDQSRYD